MFVHRNVASTTVARDAPARGQSLALHGWIHGLADGLLHDLGVTTAGETEIVGAFASAVEASGAPKP